MPPSSRCPDPAARRAAMTGRPTHAIRRALNQGTRSACLGAEAGSRRNQCPSSARLAARLPSPIWRRETAPSCSSRCAASTTRGLLPALRVRGRGAPRSPAPIAWSPSTSAPSRGRGAVYKLGRLATRSRRLARAVTPGLRRAAARPASTSCSSPSSTIPSSSSRSPRCPTGARAAGRPRASSARSGCRSCPSTCSSCSPSSITSSSASAIPRPEVARIVGGPAPTCRWPPTCCASRPGPQPPPRAIDVCNIGRRSAVTHAALVQMARERRIFYYYDTVRASGERGKQLTFSVGNASEHRLLLAGLLQRSRYYVSNRARVNEPELTEGTRGDLRPLLRGRRGGRGADRRAAAVGGVPAAVRLARRGDRSYRSTAPTSAERLRRSMPTRDGWSASCGKRPPGRAPPRLDPPAATVFETLGLPPTEAMLAREERLRSLAARRQGPGANADRRRRKPVRLATRRPHVLGERQRSGQARGLDAVEVNQPRHPVGRAAPGYGSPAAGLPGPERSWAECRCNPAAARRREAAGSSGGWTR